MEESAQMIDIDIITAENLIDVIQKTVDRAKRTENELVELIGAGIYDDRYRDVAFDGFIEMDRHVMHGYDAMRALMAAISAAKA
jgi:hypothetical protein